MRDWDLVVFCGPSLPPAEARKLSRGKVLPPARQGDVYRVLPRQPKVIALIDGLFESVPSVWHRELMAAMDAGVTVFGASSMGALRAAELTDFGMIGVGQVYRWVADGTVTDDAEVALLHADAEHHFRALTVPLVTVRFACQEGVRQKRLTRPEARRVLSAASALQYQERTWAQVLEGAAPAAKRRAAILEWLRVGAPDIKHRDAIACVEAARTFLEQGARGAVPPLRPVPSHARHRQLEQTPSLIGAVEVPGAEVLAALRGGARGEALQTEGLRTLALAAYARSLGLSVPPEELAAEWEGLSLGLGRQLPMLGLDPGQLRRIAEARCLERRVLAQSTGLFPDGPSATEGLALAARLSGDWKAAATGLARREETQGK